MFNIVSLFFSKVGICALIPHLTAHTTGSLSGFAVVPALPPLGSIGHIEAVEAEVWCSADFSIFDHVLCSRSARFDFFSGQSSLKMSKMSLLH